MNLKRIVEETATPAGRIFDSVVVLLIFASIATFSFETLPNLSPAVVSALDLAEVVLVVLFTVEYGLRVALADDRWRFVRSFSGLIDLVAILPFYVSLGIDLRSVRALRLLRILKLARYSSAIGRFQRAVALAREELLVFLGIAAMLICLSAVGIYYFEHEAQPDLFASVFHSLWGAVVTLTTVGYGDAFPVTLGGRMFTFAVLMAGLGIVAVPTGLLASALSRVREEERDGAF
jgi:voltage-gated potassium channel